jgi:hypothetical protein
MRLHGRTTNEAKKWLRKFCEWEIETDDWIFLKLCLLKVINGNVSKRPFSKRCKMTRALWMNPFEVELANYWFELTGKMPTIKPKLDNYEHG